MKRLLPCLLSFLFTSQSQAYIDKVPGSIPGSYQIGVGKYACPVATGKTGSFKSAVLSVTLCSGSSHRATMTCPSYEDTKYFTLPLGRNVTIIAGNEYFFNTYSVARFYGDEVCVAWRYVETRPSNKVVIATCRTKCFTKSLEPQGYHITRSSTGSHAGSYYTFTLEHSASSRIHLSYVIYVVLFSGVWMYQ